jgi:hypothetical protein
MIDSFFSFGAIFLNDSLKGYGTLRVNDSLATFGTLIHGDSLNGDGTLALTARIAWCSPMQLARSALSVHSREMTRSYIVALTLTMARSTLSVHSHNVTRSGSLGTLDRYGSLRLHGALCGSLGDFGTLL